MRVEKRKYKSSPSPSDNDANENNPNDENDKLNEELDNQLDNYTSLRNATPVIENVELNNNSQSDVTVIPVKIDDKSNDKKESDSDSTSSSTPSSESVNKNIKIPVLPKSPRSNKSDSTEEIIISSPDTNSTLDKGDESEASSRRLRPIQRNDIPLPPQQLVLEHIEDLDDVRSVWNYSYVSHIMISQMITGTPVHTHRQIRTAIMITWTTTLDQMMSLIILH